MYHFPVTIDGEDQQVGNNSTYKRGTIQTPVFMPVGTQGAIRALSPLHLKDTNSQIILANTYHLSQRPSLCTGGKAWGLHKMMNVQLPILTDSGGFQVFSLKKSSVTEEGVTFAYEVNGKKTFLLSRDLDGDSASAGADIAMVFDECLGMRLDDKRLLRVLKKQHDGSNGVKMHIKEKINLFSVLYKVVFILSYVNVLPSKLPILVLTVTLWVV